MGVCALAAKDIRLDAVYVIYQSKTCIFGVRSAPMVVTKTVYGLGLIACKTAQSAVATYAFLRSGNNNNDLKIISGS